MDIEQKYDQLGKLAWLWMSSPLHRDWQLNSLSAFVLPPLALDQYLLFERNGMPVGYCSWAFMDARTEANYILNPSELPLADWKSGDRLWFIDWVAPFARQDSFDMKAVLADKFPDTVARAIRVKRQHSKARVMEFKGRNIGSEQARRELNRSYADFVQAAKERGLYRRDKPEPA